MDTVVLEEISFLYSHLCSLRPQEPCDTVAHLDMLTSIALWRRSTAASGRARENDCESAACPVSLQQGGGPE